MFRGKICSGIYSGEIEFGFSSNHVSTQARQQIPICIDVKLISSPLQRCKILSGLAEMSQAAVTFENA
jgi:hypothetical protein